MGGRLAATTRANTRTSTDAAPARNNAREQASTVAPEVAASSTSTSFRPATSALPRAGTRKAPWTLWARSDLSSPTCWGVALMRLSAPCATIRPLALAMISASSADWLNRRVHCRRQCSGTGTMASLSASSSRPARAIQRPMSGRGRGGRPISRHGRACAVVVAHRRAGAVVGWRIGDCFHRQQAWPAVEGERNAEPLAIGRRDEGELGPASRTQTRAVDRLATGRAKLRQRDVNHEPEARAQGATQPGKALGRDSLPVHGPYANAASCEPQRRSGDGPAAGALRRRLCAPGVVMKAMVSPLPLVFDRRRQRAYRRRAATLGPSTFLIERVAEDLFDRLATV